MRVCITGPSHLAALRVAERTGLVDTSAHDITYFGHASFILRDAALRDGRLFIDSARGAVPLAPDLLVEVNIDDFDALFYHGGVPDYPRLLKRAGLDVAALERYSTEMMVRSFRRATDRFPPFRFARQLRAAFDRPIYLSSQPMKAMPEAEAAAATAGPDADRLARLERITETALEQLGFVYVPQPVDTVFGWQATRAEYSVGSVALDEKRSHGSEDNEHMNQTYGARMFEAFLDRIAAPTAGPQSQRSAQ